MLDAPAPPLRRRAEWLLAVAPNRSARGSAEPPYLSLFSTSRRSASVSLCEEGPPVKTNRTAVRNAGGSRPWCFGGRPGLISLLHRVRREGLVGACSGGAFRNRGPSVCGQRH